jgi:hypothetical protein
VIAVRTSPQNMQAQIDLRERRKAHGIFHAGYVIAVWCQPVRVFPRPCYA